MLPRWNGGAAETAGEFAKLSKPYSDAKPGKIAYALQYKLSLTADQPRASTGSKVKPPPLVLGLVGA